MLRQRVSLKLLGWNNPRDRWRPPLPGCRRSDRHRRFSVKLLIPCWLTRTQSFDKPYDHAITKVRARYRNATELFNCHKLSFAHVVATLGIFKRFGSPLGYLYETTISHAYAFQLGASGWRIVVPSTETTVAQNVLSVERNQPLILKRIGKIQ